MAVSDMDSPDPGSARAITALVREARSLSRRADTLGGTAAAVVTPQPSGQLLHHRRMLE